MTTDTDHTAPPARVVNHGYLYRLRREHPDSRMVVADVATDGTADGIVGTVMGAVSRLFD